MFVNRQEDLAYFNQLLTQARRSTAQLLLLTGRRRVGKSALLRHWVEYSGMETVYWRAAQEPPALQRRSLYAAVAHVPLAEAPLMESWQELWDWLASHTSEDYVRRIIILDDFPHAYQADNEIVTSLRKAWDAQLRYGNVLLLLSGSKRKIMEGLMEEGSPLAGQFSGSRQLEALPFPTLRQFFPSWPIEERMALYQMVGGVPAYLAWLDPQLSLRQNIEHIILDPSRLFLSEVKLLLYDELRELSSYTAVLRAIAHGHHTLSAISNETVISRTSLMFYLTRLQEMGIVGRLLPVTLDEEAQKRSKRGRYHLLDPFFQFSLRFLDDHQRLQRTAQETAAIIGEQLDQITQAGFEQLAREWIARQAQSNRAGSALPFIPDAIGRHWSRSFTVDVAAVSWRTQDILIAACDWSALPTGADVVLDLVENKARLLRRRLPSQGQHWTFHYAVFTRTGLTEAAQAELLSRGGLNIHLSRLERGLE